MLEQLGLETMSQVLERNYALQDEKRPRSVPGRGGSCGLTGSSEEKGVTMADESRESSPLDGFVAIVTGAAQGLGLAIAERLANDGAGVFLADLQFEKAEAEALQLRQKGLDATAAELDVSDIAAVEGFFEGLGARGKGVDILVNSAGVA